MLSEEEKRIVVEEINKSGLLRFRLKDLHPRFWKRIDYKTDYGRKFKMTVKSGRLQGILSCGRTDENHQLYEVLA